MYQSGVTGSSGQSSAKPQHASSLSVFRDSSTPSEVNRPAAPPRIRRRNRIIASCLECRRRKLKCDKLAPCTNCTRFRCDCLYLAPSLDARSQQKLAVIKERMGALEKNFEREVANQASKPHPGGVRVTKGNAPVATLEDNHDEAESAAEEEDDALEPTPLAAMDAGYEDNGDDELMDLGVQMGKMRITDRIGGWVRPKFMDELNDTLRDVKAGKSKWSRSGLLVDHPDPPQGSAPPKARLQASPKSYIGPGPDYIAPSSSFFFPGNSINNALLDYLPSRSVADRLISQYWHAVHFVAKIAHRPTLEAQYALFWNCINTGSDPLPSLQALVFAAMFSGAVSLSNEQALQHFGTSKAALIGSLRSGTEMALSKASFLRTTRVDTMQAFVMYLIPLVRAEVSRAHSALVGTAIRLAECMGLHRDGSMYNMSPIEIHVRRMIWHQLCFLDLRTCEATGPRPQIRKEDYDTKFPLNVDDEDLVGQTMLPEDKNHWTDNTLFRIRAECNEKRRETWFDIIAIDKKTNTLTATLVRIQKFRNKIESKYFPMFVANNASHIYARHILTLSHNGKIISVLHRYLFSTTTRMPDRLRQVLIESGLTQMETAIALETDPQLAPWIWYKGAFNQYHSALLLMIEVYAFPMRKDAAKIWKCLDYIFDIPSHLSAKQKAELVITDLRDRMEIFHQMRRVRSTTLMEARVSSMASHAAMREVARQVQKTSDAQALVDKLGQTPLQSAIGFADGIAALPMPPVQYSPPLTQNILTDESISSGSRQGSLATPASTVYRDMLMEDIDWNEWDKYFPVETNTGDLDIPDFDFSDFTGDPFGSVGHSMAIPSTLEVPDLGFGGSTSGTMDDESTSEPPKDMSDINFSITRIPDQLYDSVERFRGM